jgi:hypothetical protein
MTAPAPAPAAASAQPPHHFIDPSNRVWDLDRPMLDWHCQGWEWTGTSSPATGPILHSISDPTRRESLIGLAEGAGLRQVPLDAPLDLAHLLDPDDAVFAQMLDPHTDTRAPLPVRRGRHADHAAVAAAAAAAPGDWIRAATYAAGYVARSVARDITLGVRYYGNSYPGGRYEAEVRTGAEEYEVWVRYTGAPAEGGAQ